MHLWTEYEGRTIAGAYTLRKLLRSEGRNAFFATSSGTGVSAVIRVTEAHYDEEAMLRCWRQVAEVHQDNLIEIKRVGETHFEGITLTYALLEPDDANLEQVLQERPLTAAETVQVAKSTLAALSALHANGLVHEHIEPANVFAVGEVVKLRSDCVRECVADVEFPTTEGCDQLRRRDVHDFGMLLLRCLTLEKVWTPALKLPEPFHQVIPHALDGSWGLAQIASVLDASTAMTARQIAGTAAAPGPTEAAGRTSAQTMGSQPRSPVLRSPAATPAAAPAGSWEEPARARLPGPRRFSGQVGMGRSPQKAVWLVCIGAAILVALLGWHLLTGKPAKPAASATASAPEVIGLAPQASAPQAATERTPAAAAEAQPAPPIAAAPSQAGWHVVAFTYNHEDQARAKAARLGQRYGSLHPGVFSPNGRTYFVSLGGAMSEEEARSVLRRARRSGMPRDTFMRKY